MWSKWQCVIRIASTLIPTSSIVERIRSASSPGSTTIPLPAPSRRRTKQFSAIAPTVIMLTSRFIAWPSRSLLIGAHPRPLPAPPKEGVHVVAGGDVEDEHEGAEGEGGADRAFEDQQEENGEDRRG